MTRIYTTIQISKPIEQVFDYVTTPINWLQWFSSALSVGDTGDHSLKLGEQVEQEFLVAGRRGRAVWTVREREVPRRWVIEGKVEKGGSAIVTYTLTPHSLGTIFERELIYSLPSNPFLMLLNWLVLRHRVQAESTKAMRRLKKVTEGTTG